MKDFVIEGDVLTKYRGAGGDVVIPDGVKSIGRFAFEYCNSLKSVTIPDGVTRIGNSIFENCKRLTSVIIPDSVTSIGDRAFSGCRNLTSVTIPDSVTSIGAYAFQYTSWLNAQPVGLICAGKVIIGYTGNEERIVVPDSVTSIGDSAFSRCNSLTSVTIPDSVTSIGKQAFYGCRNLECVTIPDSVKSIGIDAFQYTPWLETQPAGLICAGRVIIGYTGNEERIVIPDSVTTIGSSAFYKCSNLASVTIPASVTSIGDSAFCLCSSLTSVTIPASVTSIGDSTFSLCSNLTSVTIPDGVTRIGKEAFSGCENLTSVTIPDGVTRIEKNAFSGCRNLTSVKIPDSVTSIGDKAFNGCRNLESVTIPASVTNIGECAFYLCSNLANVTIPASVMSIGDRAFEFCSNLTSVTIPASVMSIGKDAFACCGSLNSVTVSSDVQILGDKVFGDELPCGLYDKIPALYLCMKDGALKQYVVNKRTWKGLSPELKAKIFLTRQGKALVAAYTSCVQAEDAEPMSKEILEALSEKVPSKTCNTAAQFLILYGAHLSDQMLQRIHGRLKSIKNSKKALQMIDNEPALAERLGKTVEVDEGLSAVGQRVMALLLGGKKTTDSLMTAIKKEFAITQKDLPTIKDKEGNKVEPFVLAFLLVTGREDSRLPSGEEKEVTAMLDQESFMAGLRTLTDSFVGLNGVSNKRFLIYPICRYSDEDRIDELIKRYKKWNAPQCGAFLDAILYCNYKSAMYFADSHRKLKEYAALRGMKEDVFRDRYLSDVGLDKDGSKTYNLGNQSAVIRMQKDFSFIVELPESGKAAKSLPRKGADPDKYEEANRDFSEIKKAVKKTVKNRRDLLFREFLEGKERPAEEWKEAYLENPVLRSIASLLVWKQGNNCFIVTGTGVTGQDGREVNIGRGDIGLAHPMEMPKEETEAWQRYFAAHGLKQPFAQIWEPVVNGSSVKKDRYAGAVLPLMKFSGKEKHGISAYCFTPYSEDYGVEFMDCELKMKSSCGRLNPYAMDKATFTLGDFYVKKFTRYANHITGILDRWTVEAKLLKDDVSIIDQLGGFTLAQITEFISLASENRCANVTAALLEYKNENFKDYDPMDSFLLE